MRNPFDSSDDITKQEISNFVFYGRKNKFDNVKYSFNDLLPHLINYKMNEIIAQADTLKKDAKDFHSLMNIICNNFVPINKFAIRHRDIDYIVVSDDFMNFLIRLFNREVSLREMLRVFKKQQGIISFLLKNREIAKDVLKRIVTNEFIDKYISQEKITSDKIISFIYFMDFSIYNKNQQYKSQTSDEIFVGDLQKLLKLECSGLIAPQIDKIMPQEFHPTVKEFLRLMASLTSGTNQDIPNYDDIASSEYEYNPLVPLPQDHILFKKKCILFEDMNFESSDNIDMIYMLIRSGLMKDCYIGFKQCYFEKGFILDIPYAPKCSLFYKDCTFSKSFHIKNCSSSTLLRFYNCDFFGKVIFGDAKIKYLPCDIEIRSSTLKPYSTLEISNITEMDGTHYGKVALINTIINGNFKLVNLAKKSNTLFNIHNIALTMPFIIENCYFNKETVITGLSFAATPKQAMKDSIRTFAKSLQASGLNNLIIENGLSDDETDNATLSGADKDMQAYKIACESGFLKPKYAASYLGMSKDNLAKKRMADKQRITRESIPYVGQGKSISYPKDALDAYNSQDWDLLKKLREKYAQKDTGTDDSE